MRSKSSFWLALTVIGLPLPARAQTPPLVPLPRTELHIRRSRVDGSQYQIYVALPPSYEGGTAQFPVLYVLDANWGFASVVQIARTMWLGQLLSEFVIVGIGYPSEDVREITARRTWDYTPTTDTTYDLALAEQLGRPVHSGGDAVFKQFMQTGLMPWVNSTYRVAATEANIAGFSLGGLFALHVLLTDPESFRGYLIGSPSLWWHADTAFAWETTFADRSTRLPATVFLSVGELEGQDPPPGRVARFERFAALLRRRGYADLVLETIVFPSERHYSAPPVTTSRGLRLLFGR